MAYGLMLHHFHGGVFQADGAGSISAEQFESIVLAIGLNRILTPTAWLEKLELGRLPDDAVCLTFDDGLRSQIEVSLPVLDAYDLKAFWFVYSSPIKGHVGLLEVFRKFRYFHFDSVDEYYQVFFRECDQEALLTLTTKDFTVFCEDYSRRFPFYSVSDIKYRYLRDYVLGRSEYEKLVLFLIDASEVTVEELASEIWLEERHLQELAFAGHEIGLHSYDHPTNMGALNRGEQRVQYERNYAHLKGLGIVPRSVAHPCGSYSKETLSILDDLEISCGFRSSMVKSQLSHFYGTNLELPRRDVTALLIRN